MLNQYKIMKVYGKVYINKGDEKRSKVMNERDKESCLIETVGLQ